LFFEWFLTLYDPGEYGNECKESRDVQTLPFLDWWSTSSAILCKSVQNEDIWRDHIFACLFFEIIQLHFNESVYGW
jgi:hypothetical protein